MFKGWGHKFSCQPHAYNTVHVNAFHKWALQVGLVLDEVTLPYILLSLVNFK